MKETRKALLKALKDKFNIKKGKRFTYSKRQSWYLSADERVMARLIENYLKVAKSCTITEIYDHKELRVILPNNDKRRYAVKYILMFMKTIKAIMLKCNNGIKVIRWSKRLY